MIATAPTRYVPGEAFDDLQTFVEACKEIDDWRLIEGADWDLEIGALTEATAELLTEPPLLIFDNIKGYPAGYKVVALPIASYRRAALALGLPVDKPKLELLRMAARKVSDAKPIPPVTVSSSLVMQNVFQG